ncbi:MAG TPA: SBBP repeat-containing protein [Anaerolineae bacterium]|nr:SBBP repeat-containing protein [Anaerolineae bacterium]
MFKFIRVLLTGVLLMTLLGAVVRASGEGAENGPRLEMRAPAAQSLGLRYDWHTFYGVNESLGESRSVAVDADGNVYVAGYSDKTWQGPGDAAPLHAHSGGYDVMVIKLNHQGAYQWHTFYGSIPETADDGDDEGLAIAVDAGGNVYVTGYSDKTWVGPGDAAPLAPHGGDAEYMFLLKLASSGAYQWHTFFQPGHAKAIDVAGSDVYVAGIAVSSWETPTHAYGGSLVALKLNSSGAYQWHTYYGAGASSADEVAYGIVADAAHNAVYITGQSPDTWLGDGDTAPLHDFSGGAGYTSDFIILKLDSAGAYQWHTFYGAAEFDDIGRGITVDGSGNPIIAGQSAASWDSPLHAYNAERDITVLKLNSAGAYQWHTFYGSTGYDNGAGIAVNGSGIIYVAGTSSFGWLGDGGVQPAHPHSENLSEIAVLKLTTNGAFQRHTFYGASGADDTGLGIALDANYGVFVTGLSVATWQGDGGANPLHAHSGNLTGDSFVLKLYDRIYHIYLPLVMR